MEEIKVLLVDDERDFLEVVKEFLGRKGRINLDIVASAEEALNLVENGGYDAVVADYKMPGMNGLELLENLRVEGNDIPFIILTGRGSEETAMNALNKGANRYHRKVENIRTQFNKLARSIVEEVARERGWAELKTLQKWLESVLESESKEMENLKSRL